MKKLIVISLSILATVRVGAVDVDYSVVAVPEENGLNLTCMSQSNDYVAMPQVSRHRRGIEWLTNRVINVAPDGQNIAFISYRDGRSNIFTKEVGRIQGSTQRTNRSNIIDFNYSPDGTKICFAENRGNGYQVFETDAKSGFVCQQYTSGGDDYSPIYSPDMTSIYFTRLEKLGCSIWNCNLANNMLSSYASGFNPNLTADGTAIICTRMNGLGKGEIWSIDVVNGSESCILSDLDHSFTSPVVSPNGEWIACVGSSEIPLTQGSYLNTDIYIFRTDGSTLRQLTYHAADDLSPAWSPDGQYIYFISQRGNADGHPNIWRINAF